eukprot:scaffold104766_cov34-Prasinocladus_malaysianus.AAC.2
MAHELKWGQSGQGVIFTHSATVAAEGWPSPGLRAPSQEIKRPMDCDRMLVSWRLSGHINMHLIAMHLADIQALISRTAWLTSPRYGGLQLLAFDLARQGAKHLAVQAGQ